MHVLTTPAQAGAKGVVIWGASRDVNTKEKCQELADYVETVLGPAVQQARAGSARRRRQPRLNPTLESPELENNGL